MNDLCDIVLEVPSANTPKIQEGHLIIGHIICGIIENSIFVTKLGSNYFSWRSWNKIKKCS